ncbi:glycosyltransferase family 2 protein [Lutibacter sp.]
MISILIPVYNYTIQPLIENLLIQMETIDCKWEILISEDASNEDWVKQNAEFIHKLNNLQIKLFRQKINIGNAANRNFLIEQASYKWLLFLDADVLSVENNFIAIYLKQMFSTSFEIITGNIVYDSKNPLPHLLRWKYGKEKEQITFIERKNNPILHGRAANFAIKRSLAKKVNFPILKEKYGFVDTRFFLQFNKFQICVIENPVYHLGIEENSIFIEKTKKAIVNALFLLNSKDKLSNKITLISTYHKIRIFRRILAKVYSKFHLCFEKKLVSKKPSIFIFQIYKLLYISYLDVSEGAS